MENSRVRVVLRLLTAFVLGFVTLAVEIAYTRVISFKLFYYYTYFVIGLALLGLGAASTVTALSPRLRTHDTFKLVQRIAPAAALVGVLGYWIVARLPTATSLIWTGSSGEAFGQLMRLIVLSLSLTAVFFAIGVLLASLIVVEVHRVRRIYFWDLTGAGLGCLTAVPLQSLIGPPAMILGSMLALAVLGPLAAALNWWEAARAPTPAGSEAPADADGSVDSSAGPTAAVGRRDAIVTGALTAVAVVSVITAAGVPVRADDSKTMFDTEHAQGRDPETGELTRGLEAVTGEWGPVFRVDATPFFDEMWLSHDGLLGSTIRPYDGTPATTDRFLHDSRQIPFSALEPDEPHVLIIGAAGGNEVQASLTYGAGQIDAVELNPVTVSLLENDFADLSGNITDLPNVNYVQGDGRTYLARSDEEYDLIWFVAPDSYAASNAATSGAFVLSESYLYTEEMIATAYDHLSPDGMIVTSFGDLHLYTQPTRTARYLVTARAALADRLDDFSAHTALIGEPGEGSFGSISTMLLSRSEIDAGMAGRILDGMGNVRIAVSDDQAARIEADDIADARCGADAAVHQPCEADAVPLYIPGAATSNGVLTDLITGSDDDVRQIVSDYPIEISSIDDNRPFFWHFTDFGTVLTSWERSLADHEDPEIAIGERLLLVLLGVAIVVAGIMLFAPFAVTRRRAGGARLLGRWRFFVYFTALGLGFMLIEISMIQRFALLLGFPTLSLSVSLFTLLLATGIGAGISGVLKRWGPNAIVGVTALLIALVAVYMSVSDSVTESALSWSQPARILLVFVMLFPIGLLLGVFLPAGMDAVVAANAASGSDEGRNVAWCWAVNGFFSVVGSSLTTVISMEYGFNRALAAGCVLYVVAMLTLRTTRIAGPASADTEVREPIATEAELAPAPTT